MIISRRLNWLLLPLLLLLTLAACQSNDDDDDATADDDAADDDTADDDTADDDTADYEIEWTSCPSYIADYLFDGQQAQCAHIPLPLDYDEPESATIPIFIFRVTTPEVKAKTGQIWLLEGGPGGPGEDFAPLMPWLARDYPTMDVYSIDHRGVGNSTKLTCSEEGSYPFDYLGCIDELQAKWGDDLLHFSATNASRDLGNIIEITKADYPRTFVYGASYGTFWALRYLQLFPDQASGVILDSICPPGGCKLDFYDQNFNDNGKLVMDACAEDSTCAAKLGTIAADPWAAVGEIFDQIDNDEFCPALAMWGIDRPTVRLILGYMEMDSLVRVLIPPLIYRANRCNAADVEAINNLLNVLFGKGGYFTPDDYLDDFDDLDASYTLGTLVLLSELWDNTPLQDLQDIVDAAYFSLDEGPFEGEIAQSGQWPTYGDDGYFDQLADTDVPLLMLNGTLDPQTTLAMAQPAGEHFTGAHQTFVTMPYSAHGVIFQSYTDDSIDSLIDDLDDYGYIMKTCGMRIMYDFLDDPEAALDTGCVSEVYPLEFSGDSELNQWLSAALLGTEDMWEGAPTKAPRPTLPQPLRRSYRAPW